MREKRDQWLEEEEEVGARRNAIVGNIKIAVWVAMLGFLIAMVACLPAKQRTASAPTITTDTPSLFLASSRQAQVVATTARKGEGVIRITTRVCGTSAQWKAVARTNKIHAPVYLVRLNQRLNINCARSRTPVVKTTPPRRPVKASRSNTRPTTAGWGNPLPGAALTSCYGQRWGTLHAGMDMSRPHGTPIKAAATGNVTKAGWIWNGYGISVILRHGGGVSTHYAHMSREVVSPGQRVQRGQVIGYVGSTGDSTGPHLHFEVMRGGELGAQVNPASFLRAKGVRVGC